MKKLLFIPLLAGCAFAQQAATVTIDAGKVIHKVDPKEFHGINLVALWNGGDNVIDDTSLQMYKQMGMGILRFPGGVPCQWYDWKTPLASGWTTLTPENVAAFAKKGGSRMMFQTNTANDATTEKDGRKYSFNSSGTHAAEWVLAMKKAGVDVAWWEIGNEPEMDAPDPHKHSQEAIYEWYNAKYKEQVTAIKKADPRAKVMGPSATNTWFWWAQGNLAKFLKAHGNKTGSGMVDAISLHWYLERTEQNWETKKGAVQAEWPRAMDFIQKTIAEHDSRKLPLFITEWNWGAGDKNESGSLFANAMGVADAIGMFMRTGVAGHNYFCYKKINRNWGVVATTGDNRPNNEGSPSYYALALTSLLHGDVLETTNTADEANVLSAYATRGADRMNSVLLINKTGEPMEVKLDWQGPSRPMGASVQMHTLEGESPVARDVTLNGVKSPEPWKSALPPPKTIQLRQPTITLAPYSVNVLRVR